MKSSYVVAIIGVFGVIAGAIINKCDNGLVSSSQVHSIRGIVLDEQGDPFPGVAISINNQSIGVTNNAGSFVYKNDNKSDLEITATKEGYETDRRNYSLSVKNISIKMKRKINGGSGKPSMKKKLPSIMGGVPPDRKKEKEGFVTPYIDGKLVKGKDNTYYQIKPD